jgi:hypothetical protein
LSALKLMRPDALLKRLFGEGLDTSDHATAFIINGLAKPRGS